MRHPAFLSAIFLTVIGVGNIASSSDKCTLASPPFEHPEPITLEGYTGQAMEPSLSPDGQFLFFNNSNDSATDTNIYYAQRLTDTRFRFLGEVKGVNSASLDAVPSLDRNGHFYFVSTRDYTKTLSTLFEGDLSNERIENVRHVGNLSSRVPGHVNFDAEISPDGQTLYYVDGVFSGGAVPDSASILIAKRIESGFASDPASARVMQHINEGLRQYAPSSRDPRELFFTRLDRFLVVPAARIYSATRTDSQAAFQNVKPIESIKGFAEAPTLSPDGCSLYYHVLDKGHYGIWRVTRTAY